MARLLHSIPSSLSVEQLQCMPSHGRRRYVEPLLTSRAFDASGMILTLQVDDTRALNDSLTATRTRITYPTRSPTLPGGSADSSWIAWTACLLAQYAEAFA